jgi:SAM-dependent methyltransferase
MMLDVSTRASNSEVAPGCKRSTPAISVYEFGGSETQVREIQRFFLRYFRHCRNVADLGCGRGIFLELLRNAGVQALGVDNSEESFQACQAKGLDSIYQGDIFTFLADIHQRFDGIFCSHVIEHLAYEDAVRLMELCYQALQPNGRLVVVTPNSRDLAVSGEIFWLDPTHVRYYPLLLLKRMAVLVGFDATDGGNVLGSWRAVPKRQLVGFALRRLFWGRFFGRPNTYLVADKISK